MHWLLSLNSFPWRFFNSVTWQLTTCWKYTVVHLSSTRTHHKCETTAAVCHSKPIEQHYEGTLVNLNWIRRIIIWNNNKKHESYRVDIEKDSPQAIFNWWTKYDTRFYSKNMRCTLLNVLWSPNFLEAAGILVCSFEFYQWSSIEI